MAMVVNKWNAKVVVHVAKVRSRKVSDFMILNGAKYSSNTYSSGFEYHTSQKRQIWFWYYSTEV